MTTQRRARHTLVLATAGLLLAGCAAQPGTAGSIDGERITQNELEDATSEYVALTGQETEPVVVLNTLLAAEVLPGIAAEHGYALSDGEIEALYAEQAAALGAEAPADGYSDAFIDLGRYLFVYSEVAASADAQAVFDEFTAAMADADIAVNPRYGEVNAEGVIEPTSHDWLAGTTEQQ